MQILSLVGILQHAAKVVRPGRVFVRRMYSVTAKVKEMDHFTFASEWNGCSFLKVVEGNQHPQFTIQTDASGGGGCGAFFQGSWLQWQWPAEWAPIPIMAKELVPIILSCAVWGRQLTTILFQCDNTGVVAAVQKGSSKDDLVMHLLRCLWFFTAYFDNY